MGEAFITRRGGGVNKYETVMTFDFKNLKYETFTLTLGFRPNSVFMYRNEASDRYIDLIECIFSEKVSPAHAYIPEYFGRYAENKADAQEGYTLYNLSDTYNGFAVTKTDTGLVFGKSINQHCIDGEWTVIAYPEE